MRFARRSTPRRNQQGMALLIALIVLVVVTILGLVSMRTALFQNRVSINNQVETLTFQAAESGLDYVMDFAQRQSAGPDGILNNGDPGEIPVSDPDHIFNQAISNTEARRVCPTSDGSDPVSENTGLSVGSEDEDIVEAFGMLDDDDALCDPLPGTAARVTVMVKEAGGGGDLIEGFDVSGSAALTVQIVAQGDIPNSNVRSIHAEDWARPGPGGVD